jgi:dCTP deaminase
MSSIVDHQIRQLCRDMGLVEPFDPDLINPASIDVTLGSEILVENDHGDFTPISIENNEFYMPPGAFVLAATAEYIRVPNNLEAVFQLKSSRGREGYEHALAGYIDPGFHGRVTLELSNIRRFKELPLRVGMRIGQLRFAKVDAIPMRSYAVTGRYFNATTVEESKG